MMAKKSAPQNNKPEIMGEERTVMQVPGLASVVTTYGNSNLITPLPASYKTYRDIRKHPTIALGRAMSMAPIVASDWSIKSNSDVPDEWVQLISDTFLPFREMYLEQSIGGGIDFGWQGFEKVFTVDGGYVVLAKLKPLLQDLTEILIDEHGRFMGFQQGTLVLPLANSQLCSFRVEGTQWHGRSLLETARTTYNQWTEANAGAARYDRKLAGSHWVLYYPEGKQPDGKANTEVAKEILAALESSGSVAIPTSVTDYVESLGGGDDKRGWKIDIITGGSAQQPTFIDRLRYLDTLLIRSLEMPERAVLEGQFGTLAESSAMADLAMTNADLTHRAAVRQLNWYAVDQVLAMNFGEEARGKVVIEASPIADVQRAMIKQIYTTILGNPSGFLEEFGTIDTDAMKDVLGVPKSATVAQAGEMPDAVDLDSEIAASIKGMFASVRKGKP
jgi:hypothetical protein